jgi:predicted peptidase
MNNKFVFTLFAFLLNSTSLFSQEKQTNNNTQSKNWPSECQKVEIESSLDNKIQPAFFYKSKSVSPRPLIVSLHTWSGGYNQKDSLSWMSIEKDMNYIHPHFRGPNNNPEACGSEFVIQDIDDAIEYALNNSNVDTSEIHIIGASGGGHATLLAYMNTRFPVKTFSAWVPISNLVDWYYESIGRGLKYAKDIVLSTHTDDFEAIDYVINEEETRKRSPFYMATPIAQRMKSKIYIYAGIHDGYTGSVPITQSLRFYNKLVRDFDVSDSLSLISDREQITLLERRNLNFSDPKEIFKGAVHFRKQYLDKVQLTIFEGGHEMLIGQALSHIKGFLH